MADFSTAFSVVLKHEGGYVFDPADPGGETYKGIARNINGKWDGWVQIDVQKKQPNFPLSLDSNADLQGKVKDFYLVNYWTPIKGDEINSDGIATSIFDFAVNAGVATSASLAQKVAGANADGVIGRDTIGKINAIDPERFLADFSLAKIARYVSIVKNNPSSQKYFYGWVRRTLGDV
jgi:lysozyme family protein